MITFGILFSFFGFLEGKEPVNDSLAATKVRELWKRAIVEDQRDYAGMTAELRKITSNDNNSNEALTAHFIIGRIELDRAQNEATGSFLTAKAALEPLAAKHPKTWQGQMAQIVSLHILQLENHHREVVSGAERALKEIDWDLFGKNAPADLTVHLKIMEDKSQLKPDVLRAFIVKSHLELNEKKKRRYGFQKLRTSNYGANFKNSSLPSRDRGIRCPQSLNSPAWLSSLNHVNNGL